MQDDDDGDDDDATLLRLSLLSIIVPLRILPHLRLHSSLRIPVSHGLCVTTCARLAAPPISIAPPHFCNTTISLLPELLHYSAFVQSSPVFWFWESRLESLFITHGCDRAGRGGAGLAKLTPHQLRTPSFELGFERF